MTGSGQLTRKLEIKPCVDDEITDRKRDRILIPDPGPRVTWLQQVKDDTVKSRIYFCCHVKTALIHHHIHIINTRLSSADCEKMGPLIETGEGPPYCSYSQDRIHLDPWRRFSVIQVQMMEVGKRLIQVHLDIYTNITLFSTGGWPWTLTKSSLQAYSTSHFWSLLKSKTSKHNLVKQRPEH